MDGSVVPACAGATTCTITFPEGTHTADVDVIADATLIKRAKDGANRESARWTVEATPCVPSTEICTNGIDDDCDGTTDEDVVLLVECDRRFDHDLPHAGAPVVREMAMELLHPDLGREDKRDRRFGPVHEVHPALVSSVPIRSSDSGAVPRADSAPDPA